MIIESSANLVRARLASLLVNYKVEIRDRDEIACDIIEHIALRLPNRSDLDVFNLACFVSNSLVAFVAGDVDYLRTLEQFSQVAFAAKLGRIAFLKSLSGPYGCFKA